jgi:hypothetical protein
MSLEVTMDRRIVYVLPRLRLSACKFRVKQVDIGKARFLPDLDDVWTDVVGKPRPQWLDIFRDFPPLVKNELADVARGSLLISEDDSWLRENAARVVPLLFVLGQKEDCWHTPAEAFHYFEYSASDAPAELVAFNIKGPPLYEEAGSLQLHPSLGLRGVHREFRVDLEWPQNAALIARFEKNSEDRVVVACRHLFRTQFTDIFIAPFDQDYAGFCACLEAAVGISSTQRDIGKELGKRLAAIFPGVPGLDLWIEGLYLERCAFVHGDAETGKFDPNSHKRRAFEDFKSRPGKWSVLRELCLTVIRSQLSDVTGCYFQLKTEELLHSCFRSNELWRRLRSRFDENGAADTLPQLSGDGRNRFLVECCEFLKIHKWGLMKEPPSANRLRHTLRSIALSVAKCPGVDTETERFAIDLRAAAKTPDRQAISTWIAHHELWREYGAGDSMLSTLKAVLLHVARYYDTLK